LLRVCSRSQPCSVTCGTGYKRLGNPYNCTQGLLTGSQNCVASERSNLGCIPSVVGSRSVPSLSPSCVHLLAALSGPAASALAGACGWTRVSVGALPSGSACP
jgi:hypothetical protein